MERPQNDYSMDSLISAASATRLMKRLNHAWRLFGTGLSFGVFGLVGLLMGLFLFPMLFVFVRNADARQTMARRLIGKAFSAFIWFMKILGVLSYRIQGVENIRPGRNQLIIANHPTLIDVVFLVSLFPQSDCVIKEAVTKNPFMRSTVAAANYISASDAGELLDFCTERLMSGASLILFPEGTRSIPGQSLEFQPGAATVAVQSGAEILPVVIQCTPPTLVKNVPWYEIPSRRFFISIKVLNPISLAELVNGNLNPRQAARSLNQRFQELIIRELP
jgi:1-acyl-sn-glycerol-3-phosphate acyltransferase